MRVWPEDLSQGREHWSILEELEVYFGFRKRRGTSSSAEYLVTPQGGLCPERFLSHIAIPIMIVALLVRLPFRILGSQILFFVFLISWTTSHERPPLWSSGQSSRLEIERSRVRFPALPDFLRRSGSGTGSTQSLEYNWGTTWKK
jgi:hypothetical protein